MNSTNQIIHERLMGAVWCVPNPEMYPHAQTGRRLYSEETATLMIKQGFLLPALGTEPIGNWK